MQVECLQVIVQAEFTTVFSAAVEFCLRFSGSVFDNESGGISEVLPCGVCPTRPPQTAPRLAPATAAEPSPPRPTTPTSNPTHRSTPTARAPLRRPGRARVLREPCSCEKTTVARPGDTCACVVYSAGGWHRHIPRKRCQSGFCRGRRTVSIYWHPCTGEANDSIGVDGSACCRG